ncbi:MAG: tRNA uridine-5-carboxymethylaminomethyl(34) synthesis GTPase MnmE [Bdellovibrio sp.]|nr:tRNA uridine-5-carboxymethylaminomethyl(34) synthesis GTPase MnmE [Bdellovibrio sp.]
MRIRIEETICAISTPPGKGGIAVIRVSGPAALATAKKIAPGLNKKQIESHKAYFCEIIDLKNAKVDEVLVTYFVHGKSFTGEEVIEISCHGSTYITQKILDLLIENGCSMADRGEFTFRAFMNNRIDLVQAESVLSLIDSQNELSAKMALRQLDGHISKQFLKLESDLTWCLAHIEASIDFSTEGLDIIDNSVLIEKVKIILKEIYQLINSYQSGRLLKDGVKVVLVGEPNVGKSSLLNLLLQNEKAIVTEIAGTTRDIIEGATVHDGVKYLISDTAGLRETTDLVEKIGVDRSRQEALKADVLAFVLDVNERDWETSFALFKEVGGSKNLFLVNKVDQAPEISKAEITKKLQSYQANINPEQVILTSALDPKARSSVLDNVKTTIGSLSYLEEAMISSARQFEKAKYAADMIEVSLKELEKNSGAEFVAMYLKDALVSLQQILGHAYDDQIMDRVFKEFCLGK